MLDLLTLRNAQSLKHSHKALRTEQTHQIVLKGNVEAGLTRVTLTSGTATQLVVDTAGFMTLGTNDL